MPPGEVVVVVVVVVADSSSLDPQPTERKSTLAASSPALKQRSFMWFTSMRWFSSATKNAAWETFPRPRSYANW
jgi:hypothetical protein